jgi:hypothetical protein
MEDLTIQPQNEPHFAPDLIVTQSALDYLSETQKWAKFLSIMGFIGTGFMVVFGLFASTLFSSLGNREIAAYSQSMGLMMSILYILMALLYFFPTLYLYRFANKLKLAIVNRNNEELKEAFKNQKSLYKFMGIMMIVTLCLYILMAVLALIISMFK